MKKRSLTIALVAFAAVSAVLARVAPAQTGSEPAPDDQTKLVYTLMTTSKGDIVIELNREKAPISVANFLSYVDKKFYDGTIFHRVMGKQNTANQKDFMIQGGGFTADMVQKPVEKPIKNEWQNGLKNLRGTLAMARLGNQPDSATAQFFINVADNGFLDQPNDGAGYAVFGKVVAGMNVVDQIKDVPTTTKPPHSNVPAEPVLIKELKRITGEEARKLIEAEKKPGTHPTQ
jgi:peptidyl-prolyl cis-trans isomerase A (cyclophilin A)